MKPWMRPLMLVLLCCVGMLWGGPRAQAKGELTPDQLAWIDSLESASFTAPAEAGGCAISARKAAVFGEHLVPVLADTSVLNAKQQAALDTIVKIQVPASGWLARFPVSAGTYTVGLRQGKNNLQLVARDAKGVVVDVNSAWLQGSVTSLPAVSAALGDQGVKMGAAWGDVAFSWIYVSVEMHEKALGALKERKSGNVSVYSDLPDEAHIQKIADLCAAAVPVNESLTGGRLPPGFRYELYMPGSREVFKAVDLLLTGGDFTRNGAFSSHVTGRSYVWYYVHHGAGYQLPSSLLQVCIHELHHQFIYAAFPCMNYSATWWQESLAEAAAQKGLELCDKQAAVSFRKRRLTELDFFARVGRLPQAADLLADRPAGDVNAWYTAVWCLGQALAAKPADVKAMFAQAAEYQLGSAADNVLRREFEKRFPGIGEIIDAARKSSGQDAQGYVKVNACFDERAKELEINSERGSGGFALLNQTANGVVTFSGEFRWDNVAKPQVDFVLGYAIGTSAERYIKVALLPARAMAFTCKEGQWTTLATLDYETPLKIVDGAKPLWHRFQITWQGNQLRLETTDGRWAEFKLEEYWPQKGSYAGVGVYDGVAWFRGLSLKG